MNKLDLNKLDELINIFLKNVDKNFDQCIDKKFCTNKNGYRADEGYKFDIVAQFNHEINLNNLNKIKVKDIVSKFKIFTSKSNNLIESGKYHAGSTMNRICERDPLFVLNELKYLYNEKRDIKDRIERFLDRFKQKVISLNKTQKRWTPLDLRYVSYLLAGYNPKNYFYLKWDEYYKLTKYLKFENSNNINKKSANSEKYSYFTDFAKEIRGVLKKNDKYIQFHQKFVKDFDYQDDSFNWGVTDFIINVVSREALPHK